MSQKVMLEAESFHVKEADGDDEGHKLVGLAVPFDRRSRNGVQYSQGSIEKTHKKMEGRSFIYNHDPSEIGNILGHVEETKIVEEGDTWRGKTFEDDGMAFQSDIDPEEEDFIRKTQRGDIRTVSIHALVEETDPEEDDTDADVHVTDWLELSSAPVPGFPQAQVKNSAADGEQDTIKSIEDAISGKESGEDGDGSDEHNDEGGDTMKVDHEIEAFSDLEEGDFHDLISSHYEGLDVSDVADALSEGEFGGVDEREIAALIADALDASAGEVLELFEELEDGDDEEGDDGDGDGDGSDQSGDDGDDPDSDDSGEASLEAMNEKLDRMVELLQDLAESGSDSGGSGDSGSSGEGSGRSRQAETPRSNSSESVDLNSLRQKVSGR